MCPSLEDSAIRKNHCAAWGVGKREQAKGNQKQEKGYQKVTENEKKVTKK